MQRAAIVLAAGAGTRMKSGKPKVAHEILGKPLVNWAIDAAKGAGISQVCAVVGYGAEEVKALIGDRASCAHQPEQRGTADAVQCALDDPSLAGFSGSLVILYGDCPLITSDTIRHLADLREEQDAGVVVLTMEVDDPTGYGRIVREDSFDGDGLAEGAFLRIVEQADADEATAAITECNSGMYCFDAAALRSALERIDSQNAQGEFYVTDAIEIIRESGAKAIALRVDDPEECLGVNSRIQLAAASHILQMRINERLMESGVTMMAPEQVWVGPDVTVAQDVELLPQVMLYGSTSIGEGSIIGPNTRLTDTQVGCGCVVDETVALEARIDDAATAGPRAYLRPGAHLCVGAKAGTHVEIKKSCVGKGSKVPHLSYIGDTTIGEGVNIGAGSITCNYDGTNKHATTIGDRSFIGSDTMMVAPVNIGSDVVVGAGSVITKDVPDGTLAVARAREKLIEGWTMRRKKSSGAQN